MVGDHPLHQRRGELPKKLKDYLSWFELWRKAIPDGEDAGEIVGSAHPAHNPPRLDGHSAAVADWFGANVNAFVVEFGVMPELIRQTGLKGEELSFFLRKATLIFEMQKRVAESEAGAVKER